jgi:hypothetical protein
LDSNDGMHHLQHLHFLETKQEWLVLWLAIVAVAVTVVYYVVGKVRGMPAEKEPTASDWLNRFRELHAKGTLSDDEFRSVERILARQLEAELKNNGGKDSNG